MHRQITVLLLTIIVISGCSPKQPDQQEPSLTAEPTQIEETGEVSPVPTVTRDPFMQATADALRTQWATTPTATLPDPSAWPEPTPLAEVPPLVAPSQAILPDHALMRQGLGVILDSALSPDGSRLALGMSTGWFVYRVPEFVQEVRQPTDYPVQSIDWSPDGSLVLTGYDSYAAPTLWTASGTRLRELEGFYSGGWSPDGTMIAVPYLDRENPAEGLADYTAMKLFDGRTGQYLRDLRVEAERYDYATGDEVIWSPDSKRIALGLWYWGQSHRIWDVASGSLLRTITAEEYEAISFNTAGTLIGIKWGVEGSNLGLFDLDANTLINKIALTSDGYYVYWWSSDKRTLYASPGNAPDPTYLIDIDSAILIESVPLYATFGVSLGNLTALRADNGVYIRQVDTLIGSFQATDRFYYGRFKYTVNLHWLADQLLIVVHENALYLIAKTGEVQRSFSTIIETDSIRWTHEGLQALETPATCSIYFDDDCFGGVIEWDVSSNSLIGTGEQASWDDFPYLYRGSFYDGSQPTLESETSGHSATLLDSNQSEFDLGVTRADDSKFAVEYPSFILDPYSMPSYYSGMQWSPDGERLLVLFESGADVDGPFYVPSSAYCCGILSIADVRSGETIHTELFNSGINAVTWSPDSEVIALGMRGTDYYYFGGMTDSAIVLIDAATGKELLRLTGHSGGINGLAWSPDGTMLASISDDGTMIVWEVSGVNP